MSEVPTKCIAVTVTLDINASVQYIDFEGRTDGESMRKILAQIKPRQLVGISASIQYIDFEWRTDGESIRKILAQIKPRQLVGISASVQYID